MSEIWKPIKDYEGLYEVSNFGRIRSLDRLDSLGRPLISANELSKKFQVSFATIYDIRAGRTWKEVYRRIMEGSEKVKEDTAFE